MMPTEIKLESKSAKAARLEARKYAPCNIQGFTADGVCCYLSHVRKAGDKAPVATATRDGKAVSFTCTLRKSYYL